MKKILNNAVNATLCTNSYVAPSAEPVGVTMEGVLCASAQLSVQEWEVDNTFSW